MNIRTSLSLLCSLPLLLNACASGQSPQKDEELIWKENVEQRLDALATATPISDKSEEIAKLEARISLLETDNRREYQDAQGQLAEINIQMDALRKETKHLRSMLAALKSKSKAEPQEQEKTQKAEKPEVESKPEPAPAPPPVAKAIEQRQEERAKRAYYDAYFALKNGDYFEASLAFRNFLRDFPGSKLADEARYWHGESLLAQGDSAKAVEVFQEIIKEKSNTPKHAAALLKAGLIYEEQQNMSEAMSLYNLLIRQHPASSEAETARAKLKQHGGQG